MGELRKIMFSCGMEPDREVIKTDAPKSFIEYYCKMVNLAWEDGEPFYGDKFFKKYNYTSELIFSSELGDNLSNIGEIEVDESYDYCDYKIEEDDVTYQVMCKDQKNQYGRYIPDFDKLIEGAHTEKETEYIKKLKRNNERMLESSSLRPVAGCTTDMVYITEYACGHYELLQASSNKGKNVDTILHDAIRSSMKCNCNRCIMDGKREITFE